CSLVPTKYGDQATSDVTEPREGMRHPLYGLAELELEPFPVSPVPAEPRICRFAHRRQEGRCDRILHSLEGVPEALLRQDESGSFIRQLLLHEPKLAGFKTEPHHLRGAAFERSRHGDSSAAHQRHADG